MRLHEGQQALAHGGRDPLGRRLAVEGRSPLEQRLPVGTGGARRGATHHGCADGHVDGRCGTSLHAPLQVVAPGPEGVDPGRHRVLVPAHAGEGQLGCPAVVIRFGHGQLGPLVGSGRPVTETNGDVVMSVGEGVGTDDEAVAHDALHGESTAIDRGQDLIDDDSSAALGGQGCRVHGLLLLARHLHLLACAPDGHRDLRSRPWIPSVRSLDRALATRGPTTGAW